MLAVPIGQPERRDPAEAPEAARFQLNPEQQAAVNEAIRGGNVVVYQQVNNPPPALLHHFGHGFFVALGGAVAVGVAKVSWAGLKSLFFYTIEEISRRQAMKWLAQELAKEAAKKAIGVRA